MPRKFGNRNLPRGVLIDRGYVFIRLFPKGKKFLKCIGPASQAGVLDDAIFKLNHYREQIRLGKLDLEARDRRITVEQATDAFWNLHASTKKSHKAFKSFLDNFKVFFEGRYLDSITPTELMQYRLHRMKGDSPKKRGVSPSGFNKERTCLITLYNKLRAWKRDGTIKNVRLPEDNTATTLPRYDDRLSARRRVITEEEFDKLFKASDYEMKRIITMAVHSLLRLKDLRALSKNSYDPASNALTGTQAKTDRAYLVPVNNVMEKILEEGPLDFGNFRKRFRKAVRDSGLPNVQFKDLRRAGARMLLKMGVDIKTVSERLGHASIAMTERYVPPTSKERQEAADLLAGSFNNILECRKNYRKGFVENLEIKKTPLKHNTAG